MVGILTGMALPPPPPPDHGPFSQRTAGADGTASPTRGPVAVRPLNLGELLDGAFVLLVANWRSILIVTAIFVVPMQLLSAYFQRQMLGTGLLEVFTDPTAAELWLETGGTGGDLATLLSLVNGFFLVPLVIGVVVAVVAASYLGGAAQPREALATGLRRWWALIASWFVLIVAAILPLVVAGVVLGLVAGAGLPGGVIVLVGVVLVLAAFAALLGIGSLFAAAVPAIVVENLGPLSGLRRSAWLLRPRLLPVVGIVVVACLVISLLSVALGGIPQVAGLLLGDRYGWVLVAVGGVLAGLVTTPLLAIVLTLLYFDGRVRREALDLRLSADNLSATGAAAPPGGLPDR